MKYQIDKQLISYNGLAFLHEGKPMSLRSALELVCLNADPREHSNGESKMKIYRLLTKISTAVEVIGFAAEEVALLKDLVGKQLTVGAVGAIYEVLENPVQPEESPAH